MNRRNPLGVFEPERYELSEDSLYQFEFPRRDFLKAVGGGLLIVSLAGEASAQESGANSRGASRTLQDIGAWLHIGEDGRVTVYTGKTEIGQDIRTSLAQVVAEELRAPMDSIELVMADTERTPFDAGTFGSRTTPAMGAQLRRVAAAARELLLDMAAEQWKVDRSGLKIEQGKVLDSARTQALTFGQLTRGQKLVKIAGSDVALTPPERWTTAGKAVPRVGARALVSGVHRYTSDLRVDGMLFGKVLRPPSLAATLVSLDGSAVESLAGVKLVHDGNFVGVAAPSEEAAARALVLLRAEWKEIPQSSAADLFRDLRNPAETQVPEGRPASAVGSMEAGLAAADKKSKQTYTVAYIAHAPLEPRAALAQWAAGKITVWTGTQRPFGVRTELANAFRLPEDQVRVIVPDTGSAYGGKHTGEAAIEAARLAKTAGRPVKLVWTREEEFTWAYHRPAGVIEVSSGIDANGMVTAWEFHNYNSGASSIRTLYDVPNQKIVFHSARSPLRQGSYRGLAATANHFARETHMDELAWLAQKDPLEFRLMNLKDMRLRAVLEAAADRFGWKQAKPADGRGFGIAGGFEKGSYVASCAEVATTKSGGVKVVRAVTAFECGAVVNPDGLKNQIEGAVMMGIGGALFEAIDFGNGKIINARFSKYRVPRFGDAPVLETVLVDRKDLPPAGAGETPIVAIAPAIGNAIFNATGVRVRSLPMLPELARLISMPRA
ncbi:MAG: molybdopterin cofactor-binding domain-containing protein [Acidobacteriota bacterium]